MPIKVLLLFGPTGVGKTELLEKLFSGAAEVVSADALQVYKRMNIGTAKPAAATLKNIPHHLVDILDIREEWNVGKFCRKADALVQEIHSRGLLPILSGGTAYYMKSWLLGLAQIPPADRIIRERIHSRWAGKDNHVLRQALLDIDPDSALRIGAGDRYRLLRALEVYEQCGQPLSAFKLPKTPRTDVRVLAIGLRRTRENLVQRIEKRVDSMIRAGLQDEVNRLRARGITASDPGMKGIGYKEWFGTPENPFPSLKDVRELIIRNTRRFAKRQMTFFSSIPGSHWIDIQSGNSRYIDEVWELVQNFNN